VRGPASGGVEFIVPTPADLSRLAALARSYYAESGMPWRDEVQGRALAMLCGGDELALGWLAAVEGADVGYLVCCLGFSVEFGDYNGFIDELYVVPEFRRRGIGQRALAYAIAVLESRDVRAVHLQVERALIHAQELYHRAGFVDDGRLLLTKRLAARRKPRRLTPPGSIRDAQSVRIGGNDE
jgi:ribosomal protein S18 acetylase RimI-like enzyme